MPKAVQKITSADVGVIRGKRIEVSGSPAKMRKSLRGYGLFGEITFCKLRMFVRMHASGIEMLSKVLNRYPVEGVLWQEAA
ncbi:hypothetical protein IVB02_22495 [Bradyrhizobium sp. 166]|jgi:hypothetical protein|uniref:hypothetical protein n=1 Tax=Bradyrhizobium sp. 166 TaxID=2782638 RepID=UPI001FF8122A|nr:hypothetical protein [Bradyrhizobium sp. 166]MCK1604121.1 hypothetical protein [Bradyrhizobium sp. 166]